MSVYNYAQLVTNHHFHRICYSKMYDSEAVDTIHVLNVELKLLFILNHYIATYFKAAK